ncbi:hypothetical protein SBA1_1110012 [Candidatus Sulfotelmatobacter kueseliae]|uniref:Uncharacterized protein n=1 Tax=Candidatus Sulfotelmatobacter kueseliae TaxID=2042962 RepID=A0A2U3K005_9BACT|nr:hypothetical protein SBA1_1110012 [Candidatus Sulfotelmatobacter kueseliae]
MTDAEVESGGNPIFPSGLNLNALAREAELDTSDPD